VGGDNVSMANPDPKPPLSLSIYARIFGRNETNRFFKVKE
jgi:hypothetical protein